MVIRKSLNKRKQFNNVNSIYNITRRILFRYTVKLPYFLVFCDFFPCNINAKLFIRHDVQKLGDFQFWKIINYYLKQDFFHPRSQTSCIFNYFFCVDLLDAIQNKISKLNCFFKFRNFVSFFFNIYLLVSF